MSRGVWLLIGAGIAVALGVGIRLVDRVLAAPAAEPRPEQLLRGANRDPFIVVSAGEVRLEGEEVTATRERKATSIDRTIPPLVERLERMKHIWRLRHPDREFPGMIDLCAAEEIGFSVLKQVLRSCKLAGYSFVSLGQLPAGVSPAQVEASSCTRVRFSTAPPEPPAPGEDVRPEQMVRLAVLLRGDGIVVKAGGERLEVPGGGWKKLQRELRGIKRRVPNKDDLVLVAHDDVTLGDLIRAFEASGRAEFDRLSLDLEGGLLPDRRGAGSGTGERLLGGTPRPAPSQRAPQVIDGRATIRGALSREVVRRIIRLHHNEVKYCYQRGLFSDPRLRGRVEVQLTIAATGQVVASRIQRSTVTNPQVTSCIAAAARRWLFPGPRGGGIVIVTHAFILRPGPGS